MTDVFPGATLTQLNEWGYPMGSPRPTPTPALAFSVIHITANTASAQNEVAWRLNDPALQNSASFFVNPDGSVVQALADPLHMDPWTNGDMQNPDLSNPRIAAMVRDGVNANERSLVTIENVGREPGNPITPAQVATNGRILAYYHAKAAMPVNRVTVIGHYQINSVNRPNCPSVDKSVIDRIVAAAAGGDDMTIVYAVKFLNAAGKPENRPVDFLAGTHTGWHLDGTYQEFTIGAGGSFARATARCKLTRTGGANPSGEPFVDMVDGIFAQGAPWYVVEDGTKVKAHPDPLPSGGFTQAQLDAAVAKAAMDAKVIAAKAGAEGAAAAAVSYAKSLPE